MQSRREFFEKTISNRLQKKLSSYWMMHGGLHKFLNSSFIANPPFFDRDFDGLLQHSFDAVQDLCVAISTKSLMIEFFDCEFDEHLAPKLNFLVLVDKIPDRDHEWYLSTFEVNALPNQVTVEKLNCTLKTDNHLLDPTVAFPDDNDPLWDFWTNLITTEIYQ